MTWDESKWRAVPGFPSYMISNKGEVFNIHRNKLLSPYKNQRGILAVRLFRHMDTGSRGYTKSIHILVRELFPEESKVDNAIEPTTLGQQIDQLKALMEQQPDGEYHIPGVRFSDRSPDVAMLHDLVSRLSFYFPGYSWQTADSFNPAVTGITIRWRKRPEGVPTGYYKKKEIPIDNS